MPVRINLKELFGSDSQELTVDKLNFNFNKLLSLGIGLEGVQGITGGTGSAGPSGIQGNQGDKGNQWFVGTTNPNGQTFPGIMDDDFYVLSDNSQIWQYDLLNDSWVVIVDIGSIVSNYLAASGTTFVRGFGEGSPQDNRFIMFPNRGNTVNNLNNDSIGSDSTNNDILFLNNFNETTQTGAGVVIDILDDLSSSSTKDYYNAIQKIYVDSGSATKPRYHIEFGSLYEDINGNYSLSNLNQNLKISHNVDVDVAGTLYNGVFSLTKPTASPIGDISHNGIFDFQFTKFNASPLDRKNGYVQIGSKYSHILNGNTYVKFDGINFKVDGVGSAGIGIGEDFDSTVGYIDGGNYLVLSSDDIGVNGVLIDTNMYQDNGNIEQLGTGELTLNPAIYSNTPGITDDTKSYGLIGIATSGNTIIQVSGSTELGGNAGFELNDANSNGLIYTSDLNNPNTPTNISVGTYTGKSANGSGLLISGTSLCDIESVGNYLYIINNQQKGIHTSNTIGADVYNQTNLQIARFDTDTPDDFNVLSQIGGDTNNNIDGAFRIKVIGNRAIIVTNHLRDWGDSVGNAVDSQYEQTGHITTIDITDKNNPEQVAVISADRTHYLDLAVVNNIAYTISIEFDAITESTQHAGYTVQVQSHELIETYDASSSTNMTITETGQRELMTSSDNVGWSSHNSLAQFNKFGAITVSGNTIWAIHANLLYTIQPNATTGVLTSINVFDYYPTYLNMRAMDLEVIGESLYILCASGNTESAHNPTNTHIVKINTSDINNPEVISTTDLNESSPSRFVIEGNNIYVNKTDSATAEYLIPIEFDGVKTDSANIGSIKSTKVNVTNDLKVGDNLKVGQSVNVGLGGITSVGPITSSSSLMNESKAWHYGTGITPGSGSGSGIKVELNPSHKISLNEKWSYKISINETSVNNGSVYQVYYNSSTSEFVITKVSITSGTSNDIIAHIPQVTGVPRHIEIYSSLSANADVKYTVESTYIGTNKSNVNILGSDAHWTKINDDLNYKLGKVSIGRDAQNHDNTLTVYSNHAAPISGQSGQSSGIQILQDGTGDAILKYGLIGGQHYTTGIDNSDYDRFKISIGDSLSVTSNDNALSISPARRAGIFADPVTNRKLRIGGDTQVDGRIYVDNGTESLPSYSFNNANTTGIYVSTDGDLRISVNSNLAVDISQDATQISGTLNVTGTSNTPGSSGGWYLDQFGDAAVYTAFDYYSFANVNGITATFASAIKVGTIVFVESDIRIKNIIGISDSVSDLDKLLSINVTDYTLKDNIKSTGSHKKLIAQEIKEILPNAISMSTGYLPNIYQASMSVTSINNTDDYLISILDIKELKDGDMVRIYDKTNNSHHTQAFNINKSNNTFSVNISTTNDMHVDELFIYGTEVDDLHMIDYDHVMCLNISATQEIYKQVIEKDVIIKSLEDRLKIIETKLGL